MGRATLRAFNGSVVLDNFATFFKMTFLVAAGLAVLISDSYMEREGCNHGELYPLILFCRCRYDADGIRHGPHDDIPRP